MSPKIRLVALLGSLTLAACQMSPTPWKEPPSRSPILTTAQCKDTSCKVDIDYELDGTDCEAPYCYPVAPVHVIVPSPKAGDPPLPITMVWKLPHGSKAKFATDGIKFQSPDSGFGPCYMGTVADRKDDRAFSCNNQRKPTIPEDAGWKYTIHLELDDAALKLLDPWVVNR